MDYEITFSNIEWDVGKPGEYDSKVIAKLPKSATIKLSAPDDDAARDWAMDDLSDNYGFCIQGCTVKVSERV